MQVPRQQVINHLKGHGRSDQVPEAERLLPDPVDTDAQADDLARLGVDPSQLAAADPGDAPLDDDIGR